MSVHHPPFPSEARPQEEGDGLSGSLPLSVSHRDTQEFVGLQALGLRGVRHFSHGYTAHLALQEQERGPLAGSEQGPWRHTPPFGGRSLPSFLPAPSQRSASKGFLPWPQAGRVSVGALPGPSTNHLKAQVTLCVEGQSSQPLSKLLGYPSRASTSPCPTNTARRPRAVLRLPQ